MKQTNDLNKVRIESVYGRKSNRYLEIYELIRGEIIGIRINQKSDNKTLGSIVIDLNELKKIINKS